VLASYGGSGRPARSPRLGQPRLSVHGWR